MPQLITGTCIVHANLHEFVNNNMFTLYNFYCSLILLFEAIQYAVFLFCEITTERTEGKLLERLFIQSYLFYVSTN